MIPYVRDMAFDYGQAQAVSPLITRVVAENPGPFTFHGTGTYLVGSRSLAVIDPGPLLQTHLEALIRAIAGRSVTHILTTHTHLDHSPLAGQLKALTGASVVGRIAHVPSPSDDMTFAPDVEPADGDVIQGEGWTLEALATPGHAANHVGYVFKEEDAFFCGDHVMGWSTTVVSPPDGDMSDYYRSLDRVQARQFAMLWPTHGPPITDVDPFLNGYREHRFKREEQILRELRRGPRRISDMVSRLYVGIDPRLHRAAERSIWAHLIHMVRSGRVTVEGAPALDATYRLSQA